MTTTQINLLFIYNTYGFPLSQVMILEEEEKIISLTFLYPVLFWKITIALTSNHL
jgi:hypothetical protein